MPGSLPIDTYAATVAARRTSGCASRWAAIARAASPTSSSERRPRAVSSWSRSADLASEPDGDMGPA